MGIRDTVETYYDAIDADDYDTLFALFSQDVTYHRPGQPPLEGMPAFKQFYLEDRPLDDGAHALAMVLVDEDRAAVHGRFEGTHSGESVAFGFADFHQFNDAGEICERWTFTDRDAV